MNDDDIALLEDMQEPDSMLSYGFSNFVYEMCGGNVRRVPRTPEAYAACVRQCQFLPRLAPHLPAAIPVPSFCDGDMIYRKLNGDPLQPEMLQKLNIVQVAGDVAAFMTALHSIPVQDALLWGVPATNRTEQLLAAAGRVLPLIPEHWQKPILAWREEFADMTHPNVPIHGDLWYENILIDPTTGRLSGVLDFDEASIGDPAWDLATQLHCGHTFAEFVFEAYPFKNASMWARAEALFRLRPFEGLDWAVRFQDAAEFEDGLKKLEEMGLPMKPA